jgi:hypothetical protein
LQIAAALIDNNNLPRADASPGTLRKILNIIFITLGALSFLFMVIAGFRYILSGGDTQKVASAKNQIIYTAVGLVLAASAAVIVNVIIGIIEK